MTDINSLNQHLMVDKKLIKRILGYAKLTKKDAVLEIGAGSGVLTKELIKKANKIYAFEIDKSFEIELSKLQKKFQNLNIIYADAIREEFPRFDKLVANIPYAISEPLLMKLMACDFKLAILAIGENFAELLTEDSPSRISILAPAYFSIEIKEIIPPEAFEPKPKTNSAIVLLKPKPKEDLPEKLFLVRELWQQRTKKLKNALREAIINLNSNKKIRMTKRLAREIISKLSLEKNLLDKTIETLSGKEFQELLAKLSELL